jgi:hypothetical protein
MKRFIPILLLALCCCAGVATAQGDGATPTTIAIFPLKNLGGEVIYDELSWKYADSLAAALNATPEAGKTFVLVSMDDIRDQMLAQNVDVKSPSYETDVFTIAKLLGATKIVWASFLVKYEKALIEAKVVDTKTLMSNPDHVAKKIKALYTEATTTVPQVVEKILPAMN